MKKARKASKKTSKKTAKKRKPAAAKKTVKPGRKYSKKTARLKAKGLKAKQLNELRKMLQEKREDLLKMVLRKKHQDLPDNEIGDEIDSALQTVEKEILFELTSNEKIMLDTIESALRKIEKKHYGTCELCGKNIKFGRLKAMPWARYCIICQTGAEHG